MDQTEDQKLENAKKVAISELKNSQWWQYVSELLLRDSENLKEFLLTNIKPQNNELKYCLNDLYKSQLGILTKILNTPEETLWGVVVTELWED